MKHRGKEDCCISGQILYFRKSKQRTYLNKDAVKDIMDEKCSVYFLWASEFEKRLFFTFILDIRYTISAAYIRL